MSSQVFAGGLLQLNSTSNAWTGADGLSHYASLVSGTGSPNVNADWLTLAEFLAGNPTRSLLSDAKNQAITGKFAQWNSGADQFQLYSTGKVIFTGPASGQDVCGVLIHEQTDGNPSSCTVVAFYDEVDGQTAGGNVEWGNDGNVLRMAFDPEPIIAESAYGMLSLMREEADGWDNADIGYSLIKQGSPTWAHGHLYLANSNFTYITNTQPGGSNNPIIPAASHRDARYDAGSDALVHEISQGSSVVFSGSGLVAGEVVVGCVVYEWTGNVNNSRILKYHPLTAFALVANQDVRYGNVSSVDEKEVEIVL